MTFEECPGPCDRDSVRDDLLVEALTSRGVKVDAYPWTSPGVCWENYDLILIRTPWDYQTRPEEFIKWIKEKKHLHLCHSAEILLWNIDKIYLQHFRKFGIPMPDTQFVKRTEIDPPNLKLLMEGNSQMKPVVIKPQISANSMQTFKISNLLEAESFQTDFEKLLSQKDLMIQEFIADIETVGEWSLIYFDGKYSHGIHKRPLEGDFRILPEEGAPCIPKVPNEQIVEFCTKVMNLVPFSTTYGRIDIIERGPSDFILMEAEFVEPGLFLTVDSADEFAETILKQL